METVVREQYEPILNMYRLKTEHLEEHGSVLKVYTNQGPYALKKLPAGRLQRSNFLQHLQVLSEKGFTQYAPVYHTSDGQYIIDDKENSYYLMPWLERADQNEEDNDHYHKMFKTLALMHQKTVREVEIAEEDVEHHYDTITERWEQERDMMEQFLVESEKKWYMSPFELQYCTHFHQMMRAHSFASKMLDDWHTATLEQEKSRISLIHGNVSLNHFLTDHQRNGYFISLERSRFSSPMQDLVQFYTRSFHTYPIARNDRYEWYQEYQKQFPYTKEEKQLMMAYLAYPSHFIKRINRYMKARDVRDERNELQQAKQLQYTHWLVSNTEYFVSQVQAAEYQAEQQRKQNEQT